MSSALPSSSLAKAIGTYGYIVTFTLGLIGHSCSLLTFSQRKLRSTSTTILFLGTTASDVLYLFMSIYDFLLINLGLPQLSPHYIPLCRFRTFILNFAQTTSAWLLVSIAFDRLIRACLPHRTRQWCRQKNVIRSILITVTCSVAFNSHVLSPSFSVAFPSTRVICGPSHINATAYANFYYLTWPVLQICINILLPALLLIIILLTMYTKVRNVAAVRGNHQLQNQMLLLMLSNVTLYLVCTLPYGVYRMVTIYTIDPSKVAEYLKFLMITALLTILLNANYSIAFYINCLTSTLFRQTFVRTLKNCARRRQHVVQPIGHIQAPL